MGRRPIGATGRAQRAAHARAGRPDDAADTTPSKAKCACYILAAFVVVGAVFSVPVTIASSWKSPSLPSAAMTPAPPPPPAPPAPDTAEAGSGRGR